MRCYTCAQLYFSDFRGSKKGSKALYFAKQAFLISWKKKENSAVYTRKISVWLYLFTWVFLSLLKLLTTRKSKATSWQNWCLFSCVETNYCTLFFLSSRILFSDFIWILGAMCTFQVISQLRGATSHVFSSKWRSSCNVIRIKYIHVIPVSRQTVLSARLVFSEDWGITMATAFGQRKRKLNKEQ